MRHHIARHRGGRISLALAIALAVLAAGSPAAAAPPANDLIANWRGVTSIPFFAAQDTRRATSSPKDGDCVGGDSVWYRYRPRATGSARVVTVGSDYDTILAIFSGPRKNRSLVACSDDAIGLQSAVELTFDVGVTYWIAVSTCCDPQVDGGGRAVLRVYRPRAGSVDVRLSRVESGRVSGRLLVYGTIACGTPSGAALTVTASQRNGARVAHGAADAFVAECVGARREWRARLDSGTGEAFQPGRAAVEVAAEAFDGFALSSDSLEEITTVRANPHARTRR